MKIIINILVLSLISHFGFSQNKKQSYKRYGVKTGIVEYKKTIKGKILVSKVEGDGTSSLYFKEYGAIEIQKENSSKITTSKFFGKSKKETTKINKVIKFDHGEVKSVDLDKNRSYEGRDIGISLLSKNQDPYKTGEELLEGMGGEKVGTELFLGYKCDLWEVPGGTELIYKGVVMKSDIKMLGIRTTQEATSAKFDISILESSFELPKFK